MVMAASSLSTRSGWRQQPAAAPGWAGAPRCPPLGRLPLQTLCYRAARPHAAPGSAPRRPRLSQQRPAATPDASAPTAAATPPPQQAPPNTAAAAAASAAAAGALQVTRRNFREALPAVREALSDCQFYAFDCEMTGLAPEGLEDKLLDDAFDRHERTAAAAQQFLVAQFGLSAFVWVPDDDDSGDVSSSSSGDSSSSSSGGRYEARTFNFHLFPAPRGDFDVRFSCQASSLAFLASQGFDFNMMIYEGIPYMPLARRDRLLAEAQQAAAKQAAPFSMEELADTEEREFATALIDKISTWLAGTDPTLEIPRVGPGYAKLQEQILQSGPFSPPQGVAAPGFFVDYTGGSAGGASAAAVAADGGSGAAAGPGAAAAAAAARGMVLILRRAAPGEAAAAAAAGARELAAELDESAGFSVVLEAMRGSGKPAVAHNLRYDLAFVLQQFVGQVPAGWREYKKMAATWFPGGLYDTKYMAAQLETEGGQLLTDTSLGGLFDVLVQGSRDAEVRSWVSARAAATPAPTAWAAPPPVPLLTTGGAGGAAHEAGYDSYMTGAVFSRLLWLQSLAALQGRNRWLLPPAPPAPPPVEAAVELAWRVPFTRSRDIKWVSLSPTYSEPAPVRPTVFLLSLMSTKGDGKLKWHYIQSRFQSLGLGRVHVTVMPGERTAYVQLQEPDRASAVIPTVTSKWRGVSIMTYAEYYMTKQRGSLTGGGDAASSGGNGGSSSGGGGGGGSSSGGGSSAAASPMGSMEEGDGASGGGGGGRRLPPKLSDGPAAVSATDSMAALAEQARRIRAAAAAIGQQRQQQKRQRKTRGGSDEEGGEAAGGDGGGGGGGAAAGAKKGQPASESSPPQQPQPQPQPPAIAARPTLPVLPPVERKSVPLQRPKRPTPPSS